MELFPGCRTHFQGCVIARSHLFFSVNFALVWHFSQLMSCQNVHRRNLTIHTFSYLSLHVILPIQFSYTFNCANVDTHGLLVYCSTPVFFVAKYRANSHRHLYTNCTLIWYMYNVLDTQPIHNQRTQQIIHIIIWSMIKQYLTTHIIIAFVCCVMFTLDIYTSTVSFRAHVIRFRNNITLHTIMTIAIIAHRTDKMS